MRSQRVRHDWVTNTFTSEGVCTHLLLLLSHSVMSDSLWPPWIAAHQASLSFTISQRLLTLMMSIWLFFCWALSLFLTFLGKVEKDFLNWAAMRHSARTEPGRDGTQSLGCITQCVGKTCWSQAGSLTCFQYLGIAPCSRVGLRAYVDWTKCRPTLSKEKFSQVS